MGPTEALGEAPETILSDNESYLGEYQHGEYILEQGSNPMESTGNPMEGTGNPMEGTGPGSQGASEGRVRITRNVSHRHTAGRGQCPPRWCDSLISL